MQTQETKIEKIDDVVLLVIGGLLLLNGNWSGFASDLCEIIQTKIIGTWNLRIKINANMVGIAIKHNPKLMGVVFNMGNPRTLSGRIVYSFMGIRIGANCQSNNVPSWIPSNNVGISKDEAIKQFTEIIFGEIRSRFIEPRKEKIKWVAFGIEY